jgi:ATP synthase protein I
MDGGRRDDNRANRLETGRGEAGPAVSGAQFAGIGFQFALTILVFVFVGVWLDRRLGTTPWLLLVSVFVGAAGGFYSMYRRISVAQRRDAERIAERRNRPRQGKSQGEEGNG